MSAYHGGRCHCLAHHRFSCHFQTYYRDSCLCQAYQMDSFHWLAYHRNSCHQAFQDGLRQHCTVFSLEIPLWAMPSRCALNSELNGTLLKRPRLGVMYIPFRPSVLWSRNFGIFNKHYSHQWVGIFRSTAAVINSLVILTILSTEPKLSCCLLVAFIFLGFGQTYGFLGILQTKVTK